MEIFSWPESINLFFISIVLFYSIKKSYSFYFIYSIANMNFHYYTIDQNSKYVFVSCFYPIKQGVMRHPINVYKERACRLFNTFNKDIPLYIFTTDEGKIILQSSKIANGQIIPLTPNIKFITKYQSIF